MKGNLKEEEKNPTKLNKKKAQLEAGRTAKTSVPASPVLLGTLRNVISYFPYGKRAEYKSFHFVSTTQLLLTRSQPK